MDVAEKESATALGNYKGMREPYEKAMKAGIADWIRSVFHHEKDEMAKERAYEK